MLLPLRGVACACCCVRTYALHAITIRSKLHSLITIVSRCIICPIHSFNHRFAISFACCCWSRDTTEHVRGVVSSVRVVAYVYAYILQRETIKLHNLTFFDASFVLCILSFSVFVGSYACCCRSRWVGGVGSVNEKMVRVLCMCVSENEQKKEQF